MACSYLSLLGRIIQVRTRPGIKSGFFYPDFSAEIWSGRRRDGSFTLPISVAATQFMIEHYLGEYRPTAILSLVSLVFDQKEKSYDAAWW